MNETSRGGVGPPGTNSKGDPPIGGFQPATQDLFGSQTAAGASITSSHQTSLDANLPSLGTPFGNELDGFGDSLNLTRLLAGDASTWDFNDPIGSSAANQGSYRPWEIDLTSGVSASTSSTSTTATMPPGSTLLTPAAGSMGNLAPPNVLAPPSSAALPRPPHYFQPHSHGAPTYIDQRLPSFQSQFQETPQQTAAPFHPPHYSSLVSHQRHQSQFLDHQQALQYHHPLHPRPHFPQKLHSHLTHHLNQPHGGGGGAINRVNKKSEAIQVADTTRLSRPSSAASSLGGGINSPQTDLHASLTAAEAAHPTLAAQLRKKVRTSSLEGSDMSGSDHSSTDHAPGQVAAISSTDGVAFKSPSGPTPRSGMGGRGGGGPGRKTKMSPPGSRTTTNIPTPSIDPDKPVKKKRKRCGECIGCQRKDNCGECAPCRNDKSHQICKQRRCEKLTEKKPKPPSAVNRGQVSCQSHTTT